MGIDNQKFKKNFNYISFFRKFFNINFGFKNVRKLGEWPIFDVSNIGKHRKWLIFENFQ